jgi:hypothetical protein
MTTLRPGSRYPLTTPWLLLALGFGATASLFADAFLPGFAVFVLLTSIAISWRLGDPPVLPFVIGYQWVAITLGYWYERWVGVFPTAYPTGDVERTVLLASSGLLLLAAGVRLASWLTDRILKEEVAEQGEGEAAAVRNLRGLFIVVMAAYAVDYVVVLNTRSFATVGVILEQVLALRQVLLVVLWYEVIRHRHGYAYLWLSLAWVFTPRLGAYFSEFKSPLLLLAIVLASRWRPWEARWWRRGALTAVKASPIIALAIFLALLWQAGIKEQTRTAYDRELVGADPMERVELFLDSAADAMPVLLEEPLSVVESLVERLSYITFFSRVLEHVPDREPHAEGELLKMAVWNSGIPRFLFPDKPELPSDSYYTRRFAGILVPDVGTSISIGYMAEFYADWGTTGMCVSLFAYGLWIGLAMAIIRRAIKPSVVMYGAMITIVLRLALFEHQFIKAFATLNISLVVIVGGLYLFRSHIDRFLDVAAGNASSTRMPMREPDRP